jgi:hypothetical protein
MTNGCNIPALFSIRVFFHGVTWSGLIGNRDDIQAEAERNAVSTEHPEGSAVESWFAGPQDDKGITVVVIVISRIFLSCRNTVTDSSDESAGRLSQVLTLSAQRRQYASPYLAQASD